MSALATRTGSIRHSGLRTERRLRLERLDSTIHRTTDRDTRVAHTGMMPHGARETGDPRSRTGGPAVGDPDRLPEETEDAVELHQSTEREVLRFIQALPEQDIGSIDFIETPRSEAMVKLTETFGGDMTEYDATLLSDGTLRVLAIAAAVLSAPEGSIVVIEEIDNGVHPSRADRILSRLSRIAEERGLRVLISSHNPALLDALPDDAVPNVVFCYRDPKTGASRLVRLADIPDYPELIAQGAVGHLVTRGILDRFVKRHPGSKERRRRARSWLKELEAQAG